MKINLKDKSLLILIAVNLFPIIGVLYLGWQPLSVVFLYIIETAIVGLFNVLKILKAKGDPDGNYIEPKKLDSPITDNNNIKKSPPGCINVLLVPFFLVHYSLFVIAQAKGVYSMAERIGEQGIESLNFFNFDYLLNILFIIGSHAYSFQRNFIKKEEYKKASAMKLMFLPYSRIIIQQITVIVGGFLFLYFEAPIIFMLLLIILKIIFDVRAHYKIHDKFTFMES